jgi:hypothetical protein
LYGATKSRSATDTSPRRIGHSNLRHRDAISPETNCCTAQHLRRSPEFTVPYGKLSQCGTVPLWCSKFGARDRISYPTFGAPNLLHGTTNLAAHLRHADATAVRHSTLLKPEAQLATDTASCRIGRSNLPRRTSKALPSDLRTSAPYLTVGYGRRPPPSHAVWFRSERRRERRLRPPEGADSRAAMGRSRSSPPIGI